MIAVWQLYINKMVIQAKWVEIVDVWVFYEIVGNKKIRAEDQGDKDASDFREQILFDDICEAWTKNCMWQFW